MEEYDIEVTLKIFNNSVVKFVFLSFFKVIGAHSHNFDANSSISFRDRSSVYKNY